MFVWILIAMLTTTCIVAAAVVPCVVLRLCAAKSDGPAAAAAAAAGPNDGSLLGSLPPLACKSPMFLLHATCLLGATDD